MKKCCLIFANDLKHKCFFCLPRCFYVVKQYNTTTSKKVYFWQQKSTKKRPTWNFLSNHNKHKLLGTMTTTNWRKKRNFAGSCSCLGDGEKKSVPKLYFCTLFFLVTLLLFSTQQSSRHHTLSVESQQQSQLRHSSQSRFSFR